jgi:uncharacterized protein
MWRRDNGRMSTDRSQQPLCDAERDQLEALLDTLPPPLEPLDLSALDGFLVGVLLQPRPVARDRWLRHVPDAEGRPVPQGVSLYTLNELVLRRHAELERAINARAWFDPWVFDFESGAGLTEMSPAQKVLPWVAGLAAALERFPALLQINDPALREPLAVLYANFEPGDLDDADDLRTLIDEIEPPDNLADAVQDLVRCTLLLADVSRPRGPAPHRPTHR